jgi:mRNA-degrading endonuclease RelE of RelBE toxin-antitoxin system
LKGEFEALRSFRMGSFRIVYRFTKELLEVVYIDHRKDVYR